MSTVFDRFKKQSTSIEKFSFDHTANKIEMMKATRVAVPIGELLGNFENDTSFMNDNTIISTQTPLIKLGKLKVGIRWSCKSCDLDLYAKSNSEPQYLYFSNVKTNEGKYFKDFTSSPDTINGLEYIQFIKDVDVEDMDIKINFYSGTGEGSGVIRAEFKNNVYEQPFLIESDTGNKAGSNPKNWVKISLASLLNIE
jgi:hypothetical protein